MDKRFPGQDVGSLTKPRWRVKGYRGEPLSEEDVADAAQWGKRLRVGNLDAFVKLLTGRDSPSKREAILEWSAKYALRLFEAAGLDVLFDGEQWRSEMYEHVIRNVEGFKFLGLVKSFDYRYFNKAACINKPKHVKSFYLSEFLFTEKNTTKTVKIPFTGPYTLADWTFNEYYERKLGAKIKDLKQRKAKARQEFLFDLVHEVVRPEISQLVKAGAKWIQIDEPAATTDPSDDEMELFTDAFNEATKGFNCAFSLHNCYSNYDVLARYACRLRDCTQLTLEFANRDSRQVGTERARKGYTQLKLFEDYGFKGKYGLGVIDVHTDFIEPPELVKDRILYAAKLVEDPNRIYVSPDCGLRTRTWDVSFQKLSNMVAGADLARKALS